MKDRHLARILIVQALYEADLRGTDQAAVFLERLLEASPLDDPGFAREAMRETNTHRAEIDRQLQSAAPERPLAEVGRVDHQILRLALAELFYARQVPPRVVLDEAVELAKEFGGENSYSFINGVLGTLYRAQGDEETREEIKPSPSTP